MFNQQTFCFCHNQLPQFCIFWCSGRFTSSSPLVPCKAQSIAAGVKASEPSCEFKTLFYYVHGLQPSNLMAVVILSGLVVTPDTEPSRHTWAVSLVVKQHLQILMLRKAAICSPSCNRPQNLATVCSCDQLSSITGAFPLLTFIRKGFPHPKSGLKPNLRNSLVISKNFKETSPSFKQQECVSEGRRYSWPLGRRRVRDNVDVDTERSSSLCWQIPDDTWPRNPYFHSKLMGTSPPKHSDLPLPSCQENPWKGHFQYSFIQSSSSTCEPTAYQEMCEN